MSFHSYFWSGAALEPALATALDRFLAHDARPDEKLHAFETLLDSDSTPARGIALDQYAFAQEGSTSMLNQFVNSGRDVPLEDEHRAGAAKERFARQQMNREVGLIKQWIKSLDLVFSEGADMNQRKEELKQQIKARLLRSFDELPHI